MKLQSITHPNVKGQIVIPKEIRENLGITHQTPLQMTVRGKGLHIYPIKGVIHNTHSDQSYSQILSKTQGSWQSDNWEETNKKRETIEIEASQERKTSW